MTKKPSVRTARPTFKADDESDDPRHWSAEKISTYQGDDPEALRLRDKLEAAGDRARRTFAEVDQAFERVAPNPRARGARRNAGRWAVLAREFNMTPREVAGLALADLMGLVDAMAPPATQANPPLSDTQACILEAMLLLGAVDPEHRKTADVIAKAAISQDANSIKRVMAALRKMKMVQSITGGGGGSWLTPAGAQRAESLSP